MKLVLLALADVANHEGECWPSVGTLGEMTSLSQSAIKTHLRALEAVGIIKITPRTATGGRQTSNFFKIFSEKLGAEWEGPESNPSQNRGPDSSPPRGQNQTGEGPESDGTGGQNLTPVNHSEEPPLNRQKEPPTRTPPQADGLGLDLPQPPEWLGPKPKDSAQITVGQWFKRRPSTPWSEKEARAWRKITAGKTSEALAAEVELLAAYYTATISPPQKDIRRRDVFTLLNNWNGELDRARSFNPNPTPTDEPEAYRPKSWN